MFTYKMVLTTEIEGKTYEWHKDWKTPIQLRVGDTIYVDGLAEVEVQQVVWYLDRDTHAFVDLGDHGCLGPLEDWRCLCDEFDYSCPDFPAAEPLT